jgi:FkbM family methyltransferase
MLGRHLSKYGTYEPEMTAWIQHHLSGVKGGIMLDVGANVGWHSVHAAKFSSLETIVAFEPDALNAWLLDRNLSANKIENVIIEALAAGSENGIARLHRYKASNNGRHSLIQDYGRGSRVVPVKTLDSALDTLGLSEKDVHLIKIDVEGYEPHVLAGASKTLARTSAIITEYSPSLSSGGDISLSSMVDQLTEAGFSPHLFSGGSLKAADKLAQREHQIDIVWLRGNASLRS